MVISSDLEDGTSVGERRVRSTLAHEAGHAILHASLFADNHQASLFLNGTDTGPRVLCRDDSSNPSRVRAYAGEWWELQANRAIGSLLLPMQLVARAVEPYTNGSGGLGLTVLNESVREDAARDLADVFDVNPVVVRIRLAQLFSRAEGGQMKL